MAERSGHGAPSPNRGLHPWPVSVLLLVILLLSSVPAHAAPDPDVFHARMRFSRDFVYGGDPREALAAIKAFADLVAVEMTKRHLPSTIRVEYTPSLEELARELASGETHLAQITAYEYVKVRDRLEKLGATLWPLTQASRNSGTKSHRALLVVRADEDAAGIADLEGKTFAFLSTRSETSYLYPQWLLLRDGHPAIPRFFGKTMQVTKEKSALYAVLLGEADVTAVSDHMYEVMRELNPAIGKRLRILETSGPMPQGALVAGPHLPEVYRRNIVEILCDDEEVTSRMTEMLRALRVRAMRRTSDEDFTPLRDLLRLIEKAGLTHIDPICGRQLSEEKVKATDALKGHTIRFCSSECKQVYHEHCRRSLAGSEKPLYVVGVTPHMSYEGSLQDARTTVELVLAEFAAGYGYDLAIEVLPDLEIGLERLRNKTLSIVHLSPPGYVWLRHRIPIVPIVRHKTLKGTYRAQLIVPAKYGGSTAEGLRGKVLAASMPPRSAEELYLKSLLRALGKREPGEFFRTMISCPSDESALRAVTIGHADAALVTSDTWEVLRELKPGLAAGLRVLQTSNELVVGPIACRADLPEVLVRSLREYALRLHEKPRGRSLLEYFKTGQLVTATDAEYDGIRRMLDALEDK